MESMTGTTVGMADKDSLRRHIRQLYKLHAALPGSNRSEASVAADLMNVCPRLAAAHTVMLYHALPDEVATQELIELMTAQGKQVLLPRVVNESEMTLHSYRGPADLRPGSFGIMEPAGLPFTDYGQIDIAVIPGMAFDRQGRRLGRGRGYYDRFLASLTPHSAFPKIGLCHGWQLVDHVPADDHDVPMDYVAVVADGTCRLIDCL